MLSLEIEQALLFNSLFGLVSVMVLGKASSAQVLRILVLNSHDSKPVQDECLNISAGQWHGGDLIVPTSEAGVVTLHIDGGLVSADPVTGKTCNGSVTTAPKPFLSSDGRIAVAPDFYSSCQEYGTVHHGVPLTRETLPDIIPSYSVQSIIESGLFAGNSCSNLRTKAQPGELVVYVRPKHWWEKAKK